MDHKKQKTENGSNGAAAEEEGEEEEDAEEEEDIDGEEEEDVDGEGEEDLDEEEGGEGEKTFFDIFYHIVSIAATQILHLPLIDKLRYVVHASNTATFCVTYLTPIFI